MLSVSLVLRDCGRDFLLKYVPSLWLTVTPPFFLLSSDCSFWEMGEPNNHIDEDCGYIVKTRVESRVAIRSWYDAPCSMYCRFICEKEMGAGASNSTALPH